MFMDLRRDLRFARSEGRPARQRSHSLTAESLRPELSTLFGRQRFALLRDVITERRFR